MVGEDKNAFLGADPVEALAGYFAFSIDEINPVSALQFVDLFQRLAIACSAQGGGADQRHFFDDDAFFDATGDQEVALFDSAWRQCHVRCCCRHRHRQRFS